MHDLISYFSKIIEASKIIGINFVSLDTFNKLNCLMKTNGYKVPGFKLLCIGTALDDQGPMLESKFCLQNELN